MTRPRTRLLLTTALASTCALTACGSDDPESTIGAEELASGATTPAVDDVVRIAATDYAFGGVPERIDAGTSLELVNASDVEVHELVAIRLPDDELRPVDDLVRLPPDQLGAFFPLVETVIIAAPGESGVAVDGDGSLDEPGRYALVCMIPTGADPVEYLAAAADADGGPPEVDGGPPHIAEGMYAELVVE